jgi:phosphopantothenoylcysteine decarboxylase/phosphopantothenate--cysteine ligase
MDHGRSDCIDCICRHFLVFSALILQSMQAFSMASLTIRNLDETTKQALRERAARNGRSMEDEARHLLAAGSTGVGLADVTAEPAPAPQGSAPAKLPSVGRRVLLVITGGIAAYKSLDLIRRLRERAISVRVIMTAAAQQFVTPMAAGALSGNEVFTNLWDRAAEHDIGHIRLAREADFIVVAPATADFLAKLAHGIADDLASAVLLAARCKILLAPAMNPQMWSARPTQRNIRQLLSDGFELVGPEAGEMAEAGEAGKGRMSEPLAIAVRVAAMLDPGPKPLAGLTAIVTSGPTHEPIDPVRYIANRSSGKQGHAIAGKLAAAGASVTLVSGPVALPDPDGVRTIHVETARQMKDAVEAALPADIAVMVAAVADWRTVNSAQNKLKKQNGEGPPVLELTENPDILKGVGNHGSRPRLVVGFAAETEKIEEHARQKLLRKGADWIVANDVSPQTGVMGGDRNTVRLISANGIESWPELAKEDVADRLVHRIADWFSASPRST